MSRYMSKAIAYINKDIYKSLYKYKRIKIYKNKLINFNYINIKYKIYLNLK
jgi:hypothetical protein